MQGRLTEPHGRGIQFFPFSEWEQEFALAKECSLDEVEFIFDYHRYQENPLMSEVGISRIKDLSKKHKIAVNHICADFFMVQPFYRVSEDKRKANINMLNKLIVQASKIGAQNIEIPLVDNSSIKNNDEKNILIESIRECLPTAEKYGIMLSLETDLKPPEFASLVESFAHKLIKANYDSGNSSALGYDSKEEIGVIGKYIFNIHVKDRLVGGTTVNLGEGDADFDRLFKALKELGYSGSFILQGARGKDGEEVETIKKYVKFLKNNIKSLF